MSRMIIVDTDFLSSFFKIDRLDIILKAMNTKNIVIPSTVYEELLESPFFQKLIPILAFSGNDISPGNFVLIKPVSIEQNNFLDKEEIKSLGRGELGCMNLAKKYEGTILMDDRCAVRVAKNKNLKVVTIPSFLVYCKRNNKLTYEEIRDIIKKLKEKDFYEFSGDVIELLEE